MTFGERLKFYRMALGVSRANFGKTVGRSYSMIAAIENGDRQIHIDELKKFAGALGIPEVALLGLEAGDLFAQGYEAGTRDALAALAQKIEEMRG